MATWMTHFRIADRYIDMLANHGVNISTFIFANIAPDCGVLNADGLTYTPSTDLSHFGKTGQRDFTQFAAKYLVDRSDMDRFSFYLGYYLHLLCDNAWAYAIYRPEKERFAHHFESEADAIRTFKRDWYDLDKLFIKEHPAFRAFQVFAGLGCFPNLYFDFFPPDAFDKQLDRIRSFYLAPAERVDREYQYLTAAELHAFVDTTTDELTGKIAALFV